ncbi:methyltransferase family protein [Dinghuibacter silviterrae]|uniref:Phospholipid methyltransferase n=1 Tax=Dinghuibacter silviterrae TaxID=1539049 RepID=A0A4R8DYN1_9BACT|nr:methyltransferase [Dinghuibacter silviterrae]TDX02321.1 phospholipid methyltransferase [Dinghuibacter silviterrae]
MNQLLNHIEKRVCLKNKLLVWVLMSLAILICLILPSIPNLFLGKYESSLAVEQLLFWLAWFVWHGIFFARNRLRYMKSKVNPYKHAFYRDIIWGVAFGVSQMLRPFYYCLVSGSFIFHFLRFFGGGALIFLGLGIMLAGFQVIGLSRAGFIDEFIHIHQNSIFKTSGIYSYVRHPLFSGAIFASLGSAMLAENRYIILLGVINCLILPVYAYLEDTRLCRIWGHPYKEYLRQTNAFFPNLNKLFS